MLVEELKGQIEITDYIKKLVIDQSDYEKNLDKKSRSRKGIFLTNSISVLEDVLNIISIDEAVLSKKILEPSCGQGIFILKMITDLYTKYPDPEIISSFISTNIFFVDVQRQMVAQTESNIKKLFKFLFNQDFEGNFNGIIWDFTDKINVDVSLAAGTRTSPFTELYGSFDYVIGNPPYVTLYGRRDKKKNEQQRIDYLKNYIQFPNSVKNGKLNLVMLFIEHSLDLLKNNGTLSFIIDLSFFETAYMHTRKYLLEHTSIVELQLNITDFEVASGQIILKLKKSRDSDHNNQVRVIDQKDGSTFYIAQSTWYNKDDEYKFRLNSCDSSKEIISKVKGKGDRTLLQSYPRKNLRTCVMLLDMEDLFTFTEQDPDESANFYPYYQGSKGLSEKFGKLSFKKYFHYNKPLQDSINDRLKAELEKLGVKNKKRIGLGEPVIYDQPKIYIRQSAKSIIATIDLEKSSANNSLYVFSLRDSSRESVDFLYFLCGFLNADLITYYAQVMSIIRFSKGKQPQIKTSDLSSIFLPADIQLRESISELTKTIYEDHNLLEKSLLQINTLVYDYYGITADEISLIKKSIISF